MFFLCHALTELKGELLGVPIVEGLLQCGPFVGGWLVGSEVSLEVLSPGHDLLDGAVGTTLLLTSYTLCWVLVSETLSTVLPMLATICELSARVSMPTANADRRKHSFNYFPYAE